MTAETQHLLAGTWFCPICKRALDEFESMQVQTDIVHGRKVSKNQPGCGHVVRWIAPWEDAPS